MRKFASAIATRTIVRDKPPLKLTIGNLNAADKVYYATTGKDQVVLVSEDSFKRILEKPLFFTKTGQ